MPCWASLMGMGEGRARKYQLALDEVRAARDRLRGYQSG